VRPADANETAVAWGHAIQSADTPTALILTRQKLPVLPDSRERAVEGVPKGAYVLADPPEGEPIQGAFLATGSEVALVYQAHLALAEEGIWTRVVSMPSWEWFSQQPKTYQDAVLPPDLNVRVAVEMGVTLGWERYVGPIGKVLGIDRFGASGPAEELLPFYGFTVSNAVETMKGLLASTQVPSHI
jgi:transketolase